MKHNLSAAQAPKCDNGSQCHASNFTNAFTI
jgi:hypothetical protein